MCCPHTGLLQGILPPNPPLLDIEEQLEGGLRHSTPSCRALSVMVRQWWQWWPSLSSPPTQKPAMLHQHKQGLTETIYENQVTTGGSNSAIKCKLVSPLHALGDHLAPASHTGFHQTLIFNKNNLPTVVQGAARQRRGCSIRGKHHQHWLLSQPQPPST